MKKSENSLESTSTNQNKKRKASQGIIACFDVDKMTADEREKIDLLVTEFFIGCNISLSKLHAKQFNDMLKALRPSYESPGIDEVKTCHIEKVHTKMMKELGNNCNSFGTLIMELEGSVTSFVLKPRYSELIYVKSDEFTTDLAKILEEVVKQTELNYSVKVEVICWKSPQDLSLPEILAPSYRCVLSSVDTIITRSKNVLLYEKVFKILEDFADVNVPNNLNQLETMSFFIDNIEMLRNLDVEDTEINKSSKDLLYNRTWIEEVRKETKRFERLNSFYNKVCKENKTLSEAVQMWLIDDCGQTVNDDEMMCDTKIIANTLDHRFKGKLLASSENHKVTIKMIMMLKPTNPAEKETSEYGKFLEFRQGKGEFKCEHLDDLTPQQYWDSLSHYCPKLSDLGLRYTSLPSTANKNRVLKTNWDDFSLDSELQEKALFIYNSLKLKS